MRRYADTESAGPSERVPFIVNEGSGERHARRLDAAKNDRVQVAAWCAAHNARLVVRNHHQHWRLIYRGHTAEWWPSSAKLVLDGKWREGIHAHDWRQVVARLLQVAEAGDEFDTTAFQKNLEKRSKR